MAGFVQIIQYSTSRLDEVEKLHQELQAQREAGTARRARSLLTVTIRTGM